MATLRIEFALKKTTINLKKLKFKILNKWLPPLQMFGKFDTFVFVKIWLAWKFDTSLCLWSLSVNELAVAWTALFLRNKQFPVNTFSGSSGS